MCFFDGGFTSLLRNNYRRTGSLVPWMSETANRNMESLSTEKIPGDMMPKSCHGTWLASPGNIQSKWMDEYFPFPLTSKLSKECTNLKANLCEAQPLSSSTCIPFSVSIIVPLLACCWEDKPSQEPPSKNIASPPNCPPSSDSCASPLLSSSFSSLAV